MSQERVSIIWTHWCQNELRSNTARISLNSLIATTKDWPCEIIVVDNGDSEDDSRYFLHLIQNGQIQFYTRNSVNLYFGFARNQGIDLAIGDFIAFSDNDIEYYQGWLEKSVAILRHFSNRKIAVTPLRTDRIHRQAKHWTEWFEIDDERFPGNMRAGSNSWLMRRNDFDLIGKFINHRIAGTKWTDKFVRAGYTMVTMEHRPLAKDIGFKKGYNHTITIPIKRVFTDRSEILINDP